MDSSEQFPLAFQSFLDQLTQAPQMVRRFWRYAITLLLIDNGTARIVDIHQDEETLHLVVETTFGGHFSVIRPPMSEEAQKVLLAQIHKLVDDDMP